MGGFFLVGGKYIFRTKLEEDDEECMCPPFCSEIDDNLEDTLLNKSEQILDLDEFPRKLRLQFLSGDADNEGMCYEIIAREDFEGDISEYINDDWF
jgi:hypothetical protein